VIPNPKRKPSIDGFQNTFGLFGVLFFLFGLLLGSFLLSYLLFGFLLWLFLSFLLCHSKYLHEKPFYLRTRSTSHVTLCILNTWHTSFNKIIRRVEKNFQIVSARERATYVENKNFFGENTCAPTTSRATIYIGKH
jgi:hypothetical protein